jgi:hypothetical protein
LPDIGQSSVAAAIAHGSFMPPRSLGRTVTAAEPGRLESQAEVGRLRPSFGSVSASSSICRMR